MKFGKYLAARQLELPEYSSYFINYKQLKKLINALTQDGSTTLQDKKGSFFFRLERELEKVNAFYLEKESELRFRLDLLIQKKDKSIKEGSISKNSITFISLYDGFKKFSKDLDRLEQFVELNETGFTKVLKKWDKRSKSSTKELYLTTAVNVQPIFHRNQIVELSDFVANNLMELEALSDGDKSFIRYNSNSEMQSGNNNESSNHINDESKISSNHMNDESKITLNIVPVDNNLVRNNGFKIEIENDTNSSDQLYTDFYEITLQNANLPTEEQLTRLKDWSNQIISKLNTDTKKYTFSKVFMLLISNLQIPNDSILQFYEFFKEFIDLNFIDDLNGRTCLIEASTCKEGRNEIVKICLDANIDPSIKDITGRTCLHYLSENGRNDLLISILTYIKENFPEKIKTIIDLQDNESTSPLLQAIINDHSSTVEILLDFEANGFPKQDDSKPMYLPLNVACKFGNFKIVEMLLHQYGSSEIAKTEGLLINPSQCNAEGLLPLHIVASSENYNLVPLLLEYGADINQLDKLNKWSAIFYSVFTNDKNMTKTLIDYGADFNLKDEDGYDPLYYAIWEGNISVFNVLLDSMRNRKTDKLISKDSDKSNREKESKKENLKVLFSDSISLKAINPTFDSNSIDLNSIDLIPELSLPPPIIPLRKYGHNFLEKKIFLKLLFYTNRYSINLNPNTFLTSIPGRITISNNDLIPRNIMLPVLDNEKIITFQLNSIDDELFEIDFELFPTFGTRLLAKATLTSSILKAQYPGLGIKNAGDIELPLIDVRLRTIGSLRFNYEMIYPYSGKPLEISMYDTYWKLSSASDEEKKKKEVNLISFVTSSSLNGEYYGIHICLLHDGTPVVCPKFEIGVVPNVYLPVSLFNYDQLSSIVYKDIKILDSLKETLKNSTQEELKSNFHEIMSNLYLPLSEFLDLVDSKISLNLEIFYPSTYELENFDLKEFAFISNNHKVSNISNNSIQSGNNLNHFIDSILTDIFTHVRKLRNDHSSASTRQLVLSSNNPYVCTILNWKQPNYPVFYNMNGIKYDNKIKEFFECTCNGLLKKQDGLEKTEKFINEKNKISIDNIDSINKDSTEYINSLDYDDKLTRSIKLAINYACANNLLGITVPERILNLSPEVVKSIRSKGLILVASKDDCDNHLLKAYQDYAKDSVYIDDDEIEIDNDEPLILDEDMKNLENEGDIKANGLRFKDILTFTDSIQV